MARIIGVILSVFFTVFVLAGIAVLIVVDLFGQEGVLKAWRSATAENTTLAEAKALKGAKNITFFQKVKPDGYNFVFTTGVEFADVNALARNEQASRWCYTVYHPTDAVPRQITIATQTGNRKPVFTDLSAYPAGELRPLGVDAETLLALAKKHCQFAPADRAPSEKSSVTAFLRRLVGA